MNSRCCYSILQMEKQGTGSSSRFIKIIELIGRRAMSPDVILFYLLKDVVSGQWNIYCCFDLQLSVQMGESK